MPKLYVSTQWWETGDVLVRPSMPPSDAMKPNPLSVEALRANFTRESGKWNQMCIRSECYFRKLVMNTERKWNTWSCFVTSDVWKSSEMKKATGPCFGPQASKCTRNRKVPSKCKATTFPEGREKLGSIYRVLWNPPIWPRQSQDTSEQNFLALPSTLSNNTVSYKRSLGALCSFRGKDMSGPCWAGTPSPWPL